MKKSSKVLLVALLAVSMIVVTALGAMASVTSTAVIYGETVDVADKTSFDVTFSLKDVRL